jgi:hypothetical protein
MQPKPPRGIFARACTLFVPNPVLKGKSTVVGLEVGLLIAGGFGRSEATDAGHCGGAVLWTGRETDPSGPACPE